MKKRCIDCKYYYFKPPQHDQPYVEFYCLKNHWEGITFTEDYEELFKEIDCNDFNAPPKPPNQTTKC